MSSLIKIVEVDSLNKRQVRDFCDLPFTIYSECPGWVPPIQGEVEAKISRKKNPFFKHSEGIFLLAYDSAQNALGRVAVLDNARYNEFNHEKTAFFTLFESVDNPEISKSLFQAGFDWARKRGLTEIIGPKGFNALDGLGLLIKGFEHRPAFGIPYNPPYYPHLIEESGFIKSEDIVSGYMNAKTIFPPEIHDISRKVQEKRGLRVERFKRKADLLKLLPKLRDLYNASLEGTRGNVPLTDEEVQTMANQLLLFADPRFIKILFKGEQPVGYLFAYPDISAAVQRQSGRIFPFGWFDFLGEMKRTDWININGAGIVADYRGMGGTAVLFSEMQKSVIEGGFKHVDIVQVGVDNDRMQNDLKRLGIEFYKTHRMYKRSL